MHISLDLIEAVYYVCTLLLELPFIAKGDDHRTSNQRFVNMPERQLTRQRTGEVADRVGDRGMGPPETTPDHIIAGALPLLKGAWRLCTSHLRGLSSRNHISGGVSVA